MKKFLGYSSYGNLLKNKQIIQNKVRFGKI